MAKDAPAEDTRAEQGAVEEQRQPAAGGLLSKLIPRVARFCSEHPVLVYLRFRIQVPTPRLCCGLVRPLLCLLQEGWVWGPRTPRDSLRCPPGNPSMPGYGKGQRARGGSGGRRVLSPASEEDRLPGVQRPHGVNRGSLLTPLLLDSMTFVCKRVDFSWNLT